MWMMALQGSCPADVRSMGPSWEPAALTAEKNGINLLTYDLTNMSDIRKEMQVCLCRWTWGHCEETLVVTRSERHLLRLRTLH